MMAEIQVSAPVMNTNRISCERLVALVRENPALYDYSHPAHCNRDVTSGMWTQIAAELGTSGKYNLFGGNTLH